MTSTPMAAAHPHRNCGSCGASNNSMVHRQRFVVPEGYPLPAEYAVVCCSRCRFVYADAAASQQDYNRFYRDWSKYDDGATSTGSGLSRHDAERLRVTAADLARALPSLNLRILDAGCATGGLLGALRVAGFTAVAGLDPSPRCSEICRQKGFEAYTGTIAAPPAQMPRFDCVVLSHVLEHVYDVPAFFGAVRKTLAPGGYLYLETPDARRYVDYLYAPFQEFNTEHINHFSKTSLESAARRFGFEAVVAEEKLLQTGEAIYYPAVFGIFRLVSSSGPVTIACDEHMQTAITKYVQHSEKLMHQIDLDLRSKLKAESRVILWGAGQLAMKLLDLPVLRQTSLIAVVDSNPVLHGKRLGGARIIAPEALTDRTATIVIATLLHQDEIASRIRELGLANKIVRLLRDAGTPEITA